MTTLAELGRMLIEVGENGKVLERKGLNLAAAEWLLIEPLYPFGSLLQYEYRLKPKVVYYRVYENTQDPEDAHCSVQDEPFLDADHPIWVDEKIIKDFEIEEGN